MVKHRSGIVEQRLLLGVMAIAAPIVACMVFPTLIEPITKSHFICHESFLTEIGVVLMDISTIFPSETVC